MKNSGYTHEFLDEISNFKGFDHIAEQESALMRKLTSEYKQKTLNKKIKKVKAELRREDVDDLKEVLGIDAEALLIETLNDELDAAVRKENTRLKRDILNKKIKKVRDGMDDG